MLGTVVVPEKHGAVNVAGVFGPLEKRADKITCCSSVAGARKVDIAIEIWSDIGIELGCVSERAWRVLSCACSRLVI